MDTETLRNPPADWVEIDTEYDFQQRAWQNEATTNVLVIEEKVEPFHDEEEGPDISAVLIDELGGDPDPIRSVIEDSKKPAEVLRAALDFMIEAPGGD